MFSNSGPNPSFVKIQIVQKIKTTFMCSLSDVGLKSCATFILTFTSVKWDRCTVPRERSSSLVIFSYCLHMIWPQGSCGFQASALIKAVEQLHLYPKTVLTCLLWCVLRTALITFVFHFSLSDRSCTVLNVEGDAFGAGILQFFVDRTAKQQEDTELSEIRLGGEPSAAVPEHSPLIEKRGLGDTAKA